MDSDQLQAILTIPDDTFNLNTELNETVTAYFKDSSIEGATENKQIFYITSNNQFPLTQMSNLIHVPRQQIYLKPPSKLQEEIQPSPVMTPYKCIKCNKEFDTIALYKKHMLWHRNTKKYPCSKCSQGYNNERNLIIHMATHPEGKPTCPVCNLSFQRLASLKSHLMLHQVDEGFVCEECKAEFDKEDELIKHMELHIKLNEEPPNLICPYCKVSHENPIEYKKHISQHVKLRKMVLKGKRFKKKPASKMQNKHVCVICSKSFIKASLLERHLRIHTGEKPFVCRVCNRGFTQNGTLRIHMKTHIDSRPYHCTLCPARFTQKGNLKVHIDKTHTAASIGSKIYKCTLCMCIFKKVGSLNTHMSRFHSENIGMVMDKLKELEEQLNPSKPKKDVLEKPPPALGDTQKEEQDEVVDSGLVRLTESGQDGTIKRHLVKRERVGVVWWYCCSYCSKKCKKPSDLIRHFRVHTKEKPFQCQDCGVTFTLKSTLVSHMKTHAALKEYKCGKCEAVFTCVRSLSLHLSKHEKMYTTNYQCNICNKMYGSLEEVSLHRVSDHLDDSKPLENLVKVVLKRPVHEPQPGVINPAKPRNSLINLPIKANNADTPRPFQCTICDARFTRQINLKRHVKVHENDRQYKCDMCPRAFISSYRLTEHLKYHNNIRKFECQICQKKFVTSTLLKRHVSSHSSKRPYTCPYCSKKFKSLMLTKTHIRRVHKLQITQTLAEDKDENPDSCEALSTDLDKTTGDTSLISPENTTVKISIGTTDSPSDSSNVVVGLSEQFFQIPQNTLQILNQNVEEQNQPQPDPQVFQTIYVNYDDLQLTDSELCNNVLGQIKLHNADSLLLNAALEDTTVIFNIDATKLQQELELSNDTFNAAKQIYDENNMADIVARISSNKTQDSLPLPDLSLSSIQNAVEGGLCLNGDLLATTDTTPQSFYFSPDTLNMNPGEQTLDETDLICINCNQVFNSIKVFKAHECGKKLLDEPLPPEEEKESPPVEKKKPVFECHLCKLTFPNRNWYKRHLESHAKDGSMNTCSYCKKEFKKPSDLKRHLRTHTGEKPYACKKCDKKFALKSTLDSHTRTHDSTNKYVNCDVCNAVFTAKSSLKVHMFIHEKKKPYICNFCPSSFRTAAHRRVHERSQHVAKDKPKKQPKDVKITDLLETITEQVAQSLNNPEAPKEPLELPQPPPPVSDEEALSLLNLNTTDSLGESIQIDPVILLQQLQANNILVNDGADNDMMPPSLLQLDDVALLNFKSVDGLMEIKNDLLEVPEPKEKPKEFQCDVCFKQYSSKGVLRRHKKIHERQRQYSCDTCIKGFNKPEELEKHLLVHSGIRPYSCMFCNNAFAEEQSLKTHMKRIHNVDGEGTLVVF